MLLTAVRIRQDRVSREASMTETARSDQDSSRPQGCLFRPFALHVHRRQGRRTALSRLFDSRSCRTFQFRGDRLAPAQRRIADRAATRRFRRRAESGAQIAGAGPRHHPRDQGRRIRWTCCARRSPRSPPSIRKQPTIRATPTLRKGVRLTSQVADDRRRPRAHPRRSRAGAGRRNAQPRRQSFVDAARREAERRRRAIDRSRSHSARRTWFECLLVHGPRRHRHRSQSACRDHRGDRRTVRAGAWRRRRGRDEDGGGDRRSGPRR